VTGFGAWGQMTAKALGAIEGARIVAVHCHGEASDKAARAQLPGLIAALVLPGASWRIAWLVAAGASALMLAALLLRAQPRHELDALPVKRKPVLHEMAEVASTGGPLAIALCFGAYSCCWYTVIGFLPTLL